MNKIVSKNKFIKSKILTPKYFSFNNQTKTKNLKELMIQKKIKFPVVVKPINEGSSLELKFVKIFYN